jgi:hypothetical protein
MHTFVSDRLIVPEAWLEVKDGLLAIRLPEVKDRGLETSAREYRIPIQNVEGVRIRDVIDPRMETED